MEKKPRTPVPGPRHQRGRASDDTPLQKIKSYFASPKIRYSDRFPLRPRRQSAYPRLRAGCQRSVIGD